MTEKERLESLIQKANERLRTISNPTDELEAEFAHIEDADMTQKDKSGSGK
ncbi:hypothetical protein ACNGB2_00625 [Campylobacter coli]